jgi:hypothetical protein
VNGSTQQHDYEPYVISPARLGEIRAMFTDRDEFDNWRLEAVRGVTKDDLVGAVYDLLGERDDAVCACGRRRGEHRD